ncbi:MAG: hypothetical protein ACRDUW_15000 [Pseudonocardiaceae bacterium]
MVSRPGRLLWEQIRRVELLWGLASPGWPGFIVTATAGVPAAHETADRAPAIVARSARVRCGGGVCCGRPCHTPWAIATEAGALVLFTAAAFALTRHQAAAAEPPLPDSPRATELSEFAQDADR